MCRFNVLTDDGLPGGYLLIDPDLSEPGEIAFRLCFVDEEHVTVFVREEALRAHIMEEEPWVETPKGALRFDYFEDSLEVSMDGGAWLARVVDYDACARYLTEICGLVPRD